jgi:hypothetical protein
VGVRDHARIDQPLPLGHGVEIAASAPIIEMDCLIVRFTQNLMHAVGTADVIYDPIASISRPFDYGNYTAPHELRRFTGKSGVRYDNIYCKSFL